MPHSEASVSKRGRDLIFYLLAAVAIVDGFLLANGFFQSGVVYLGISLLAGGMIFILLNRQKNKLPVYGVGMDYIADGMYGLLAGVALTVILPIFGLSLGIPLESLALGAQWAIVVFIAPIAEELLFRVGVYNLFFKGFNVSHIISNLVQAGLFAVYHINVYAGQVSTQAILSVSTTFITAFLAGLFFEYIYIWRKSFIAPVGAHMAYNAILFADSGLAFGV